MDWKAYFEQLLNKHKVTSKFARETSCSVVLQLRILVDHWSFSGVLGLFLGTRGFWDKADGNAVLNAHHQLHKPEEKNPLRVQIKSAATTQVSSLWRVLFILTRCETETSQLSHGVEAEYSSGDDARNLEATNQGAAGHTQNTGLQLVSTNT